MAAEHQFKEILDAEAWVHVARIVDRIPTNFPVARWPDDSVLIGMLADVGAYDALAAMHDALQVYLADVIFAAVRAACARPMLRDPAPTDELPDEAEWVSMFEQPWLTDNGDAASASGSAD